MQENNKIDIETIRDPTDKSSDIPIEMIPPPEGVSQEIIDAMQKPPVKNNLTITTSAELLQKTPKAMPYIVEKMIPENAITAITADSGVGKSLFALILASHVATGEPLFGTFKVKKNKVLILDLEMDENTIISRYQSIFNKPVDIDIVYEQSWKIDHPPHYNWLKKTILEKGYGVVIFDTLVNIHSKNENSSDEMKLVNEELLRLMRETGVTIIFLHHHRKLQPRERYGQNSSRGSTEIINKTSSHLLLTRMKIFQEENGNFINSLKIKQEKSRQPGYINAIGVDIKYDHTNKTTWEYKGIIDIDKNKIDEAKENILEILSEEDKCTVGQFKEKIQSVGESNIRKALKELENEEKIKHCRGEGEHRNTNFYSMASEE